MKVPSFNTIKAYIGALLVILTVRHVLLINKTLSNHHQHTATHPAPEKALVAATQTNDCLSRIGNVKGIKLYSQNDEDGAILQTLRCMGGHGTKEYFEFGSEDGTQVNTRLLRDLYGWHGHLLDGSNENAEIPLHKEFFTPSNIVSLLQKYGVGKNLDVLSVDCDYDDLYTTREILVNGYKPRVLINEYNVNFGSEWAVSTVAKPVGQEHTVHFKGNCYFGASAMALIRLVEPFGYIPVYSNDVNLIFVRLDQAQKLGMIIPSVENFPGPYARALHRGCPGRKWASIDFDIVKMKATDPNVSHTQFADSFPTVQLSSKDFPTGKRKGWRIFQEDEKATD